MFLLNSLKHKFYKRVHDFVKANNRTVSNRTRTGRRSKAENVLVSGWFAALFAFFVKLQAVSRNIRVSFQLMGRSWTASKL